MLEHENVLPTSGIKACTSVVVAVSKNVDGHKYQAEIEFLSKEVCASAWVLA